MERVDDTPGHAQDNLADKSYAHVRRSHVEQASQAYGHECHEQRFEADEARRQAEREYSAQHCTHTAGRREPAHPFDTDVQDIAVEERLQRIEGAITKVRKENDAKQQGENAIGKDRLDTGREGGAGGRAGVGALSRTLPFLCRIGIRIPGDMAGLRPKAPTDDERQHGKEHQEHKPRARRRSRREKATQRGSDDNTHV